MDFQSISRWLLEEGPSCKDFRAVVQGLADRLVASGLPLLRLNVGVDMLHPEMLAAKYIWHRGDRFVHRTEVPHGIVRTDIYENSPYRQINEGTVSIRRRLSGADAEIDFPVLEDLQEQGGSDYLVVGLPRSDGRVNRCSYVIDRPSGFTDEELSVLTALRVELGLIAELFGRARMTRGLLNLYLGPEAGSRVYNGHIRRGETAVIRSVIWISDLRSFTHLSEILPLNELTALLNQYFEATIGPVHAHGGEVLKLIGDGVLAVFRIESEDEVGRTCEDALSAAELAMANIGLINHRRSRSGDSPLVSGIGLHVGDAMYGNVGTGDRLDFTVIGPDVNLCARLEELAGETGETIVCSARFVEHIGAAMRSIGFHKFKNIADAVEAFAPAGDGGSA